MTLIDALLAGGFEFPRLSETDQSDPNLLDTDGISLFQRKNQLMRRLRILKKKGKSLSLNPDQICQNRSSTLAIGLSSHPVIKGVTDSSGFFKSCGAGQSDSALSDPDRVSLLQRKNQLLRMLTKLKTNESSFGSDDPHQRNSDALTNKMFSDPDATCMITSTTELISIPEMYRNDPDNHVIEDANYTLTREKSYEIMAGKSELTQSVKSSSSSTPQFDSLNVMNSIDQLLKHYQERDT
eukprot:CAMPEP_0185739598 /NCGR_PEP_ID=MMETSP1171-20130828/35790_1 /TAXON_ID=374046 /ORGANISM="Helicotheca tamensis, Strain CCMP826" /LENGTH=238 /DNA_ID=CAMNT_0028411209 /DNA_START=102 /DNA_END=818 /DNA_ORIENTATION=+